MLNITRKHILRNSICAILGLSLTNVCMANPNDQNSNYVKDVSIKGINGINTNIIVLKNHSSNKQLSAINIQPQSQQLKIYLNGSVKCAKNKKIDFKEARAFFGPIKRSGNSILTQEALYSKSYNPTISSWKPFKWITESGNHEPFIVPLSKMKNGKKGIRFDPVVEIEKALEKYLSSGKSALDFYKKDRFITVHRPISLAGVCAKFINPGKAEPKPGYDTNDVKITI